jgi:ornithine carbamoyltransferase
MPPFVNPLFLGRLDDLPTAERDALADSARWLKREALAGAMQKPLHGRNVALLCEDDHDPAAALFERAASALGATVAHIRPSLSDLSSETAATARVLGRLYDAINCQDLPTATVDRIRAHAGVPVYENLASPAHPSAPLAARLNGGKAGDTDRHFVIQAVLLATICWG